ncbi:hypothetical protein QZH41_014353 [Actinostola sp. cb2023]|nr:hypothetical protein QZH41_014353 [Actinostola sp. cb2023]
MADSDSSSGEESSSQASTCSSSSVLDLEGEIKPYMFEPRYKSDEIPSSISNDEEMPLIEEELSDRLHNSDWCTCDHCQIQDTSSECLCCQECEKTYSKLDDNILLFNKESSFPCI